MYIYDLLVWKRRPQTLTNIKTALQTNNFQQLIDWLGIAVEYAFGH